MLRTWADVEAFLLDAAADDLAEDRPVVPVVVAFCGEKPLFFSGLRDFHKGEYHDPMIELLALAAALGANRVASAFSGRAWSLRDPVPPVVDGVGDLRQRVLVMTFVDATATPTLRRSAVVPYDVTEGHVRWQTPLRDDAGEGWITEAMTVCAQLQDRLRSTDDEARRQAQRCVDLGHLLVLHPGTAQELNPGLVAAATPPRPRRRQAAQRGRARR